MIITSNRGFVDWCEEFNDHILGTAILDRLLHHATSLLCQARKTGGNCNCPKPSLRK